MSPRDRWNARLALVRSVARAASSPGRRALATLEETQVERVHLDTRSLVAPSTAERSLLLTLRVEGPRGIGSSEVVLGPAALASPRDLSRALVARALEDARRSRTGGSLEGALEGETGAAGPRVPVDGWALLDAATEGALAATDRTTTGLAVVLDLTLESSRTAVACSGGGEPGREHARSRSAVVATGEVSVVAGGRLSTASLGLAAELTAPGQPGELALAFRTAARDACRRARARRTLVPLGRAGLVLVGPEVLAWILHGPLVEGFSAAVKGARVAVPRWLAVSDPAAGCPGADEQGVRARPVPLAADGRWLRGTFRAFDGSGRTRRDPRTGEVRAGLASLACEARPARPGFVQPRRRLASGASLVLGEVASADPLPGGGVFVVSQGLRRLAGRWRPTGLVGLRLDEGELFRSVVGASTELDLVHAQALPVLVPSLLVRDVSVRLV